MAAARHRRLAVRSRRETCCSFSLQWSFDEAISCSIAPEWQPQGSRNGRRVHTQEVRAESLRNSTRRVLMAARNLNCGPMTKTPEQAAARKNRRPVKAPGEGRQVDGRRDRLIFRAIRAAALKPQVGGLQVSMQARLRQPDLEDVARHAAGTTANPSRHHLRQIEPTFENELYAAYKAPGRGTAKK